MYRRDQWNLLIFFVIFRKSVLEPTKYECYDEPDETMFVREPYVGEFKIQGATGK